MRVVGDEKDREIEGEMRRERRGRLRRGEVGCKKDARK